MELQPLIPYLLFPIFTPQILLSAYSSQNYVYWKYLVFLLSNPIIFSSVSYLLSQLQLLPIHHLAASDLKII